MAINNPRPRARVVYEQHSPSGCALGLGWFMDHKSLSTVLYLLHILPHWSIRHTAYVIHRYCIQPARALVQRSDTYNCRLSSGFVRFYSSSLLKHVQYLVNTRNCENISTFCAWYQTSTLPFTQLLPTNETLL